LDKYSRETRFAFDYIFGTLGLSHRFITDPSHLRQHDILLLYGLIEPTLDELQQLTRQYITIFIPCEPRLYDPQALPPDQLRKLLREAKIFTPTPVLCAKKFEYPAENYADLNIHACKVNFDLPGNVFFQLASLEESCDSSRDHSGCLPETASAFYQWKDIPFVDNFLWLLDNLIKEQAAAKGQYLVQKHYWPKAEDMAIALTHSVDDLQKWDFSSMFFSVADDFSLLVTLRWKQLLRNLWSKLKYIFTNYEMYWNFQELQTPEKELHLRSTWFISAESTPDIDYSLDDLDLQDEIKTILRLNNEIGLLATNDKQEKEAWAVRKQIMLRQNRKDGIGLRQHDYIRNEQVKELQDRVLPLYTSGLSFRETAGFRQGMIFPFQPWLGSLMSNHVELPVCFRDNCLKTGKFSYLSLEDAKQIFKKVFQAVRRRRGLFITDFTVANYTDIPYCAKLYSYILALIRAEKSYHATLAEIADWWQKRSRVTIDESEYDFSISFPDALESFALQYTGNLDIIQVEGVQAKIEGKNIFFSNLTAGSQASFRLGKTESGQAQL
jgi:hypothetical protein